MLALLPGAALAAPLVRARQFTGVDRVTVAVSGITGGDATIELSGVRGQVTTALLSTTRKGVRVS